MCLDQLVAHCFDIIDIQLCCCMWFEHGCLVDLFFGSGGCGFDGQELNIDPKVVRFRFKADNPMASVILANSITLTPGTVTMNVTDDGVYEIHALTVGAAAGVLDGGMQKKVADLYGEKFDFAVVESEE